MLFFKKIEKVLKVENMKCAHCAAKVETALKGIDGVKNVKVDLSTKIVKIILKKDIDTDVLVKAVVDAGFDAQVI